MTDEEKRERKREYARKFRESHPGYYTEYLRKYRKKFREEHSEEYKARNREYQRKYRETHREHHNEYCREYQRKHKEAQQKRMNNYHQTKKGRAMNLLTSYVQMDLERRGGERPQLTQEDIMRMCMSDDSKCVYCENTNWKELGLDRINNDLPHHAWNCVCACHDCNVKRYTKDFGEYVLERCGTWEQFAKQNNIIDNFPNHFVLVKPKN